MFGVQMLAEQALQGRRVAGFYYEQGLVGDITERFYSYSTGHTRKELSGNAENYDPRIHESLDKVEPIMRENLALYDMAGGKPTQGAGGVLEIESIVTDMHRSGKKPEVVLVDWLGPLVERQKAWPQNMAKADLRQRYNHVLLKLHEMKERHGITVVLLHQIAPGQVENKSPSHKFDWTVAAECKGFGHYMDYVFTFGRKCEKTNCMWFNAPKARGAPNASRVVRMDAMTNRICDASNFQMDLISERRGDATFVDRPAGRATA